MIGRIYKIYYNDIVYIGSTIKTLRRRLSYHKSDYKRYLNKKRDNIAIFEYFTQHGVDNFKIELIKEYEVCDKKHLSVYEQLWMNKLKNVNTNKAFRIRKLYDKKHHKEYNKLTIYCEACKKDINLNSKSKHYKTKIHINNLKIMS